MSTTACTANQDSDRIGHEGLRSFLPFFCSSQFSAYRAQLQTLARSLTLHSFRSCTSFNNSLSVTLYFYSHSYFLMSVKTVRILAWHYDETRSHEFPFWN